MTDNENIKDLEGAILNAKRCDSKVWSIEVYKLENALDSINQQKAEIERLQKEVNLVSIQFQDIQERQEESQAEIDKLNEVYQANQQLINALNKSYFLAKSEAYKEFAERLKEKSFQSFGNYGITRDVVEVCDIDNLIKEFEKKENTIYDD